MNITLIRHPQTTANKNHIIYGVKDFEYTERGEHQYLWIKEYMEMNYSINNQFQEHKDRYHIISSPRGRALKLAQGISKELGIDLETKDEIGEMNFGIFEGLSTEEAKQKHPDAYFNFQYHFDTTAIPGGESYEDFMTRMDRFIDYLGSLHGSGQFDEIIIVSHGGVIRELTENLLELEPGTSWKFSVSNGCIIKLELKEDGYRLKELVANKF